MNKSVKSEFSNNDNTYNFYNELDISNTKKDRTGDNFFNFEDFQNLGDDRTIKSSNHKSNLGPAFSAKDDKSNFDKSSEGGSAANHWADQPIISNSIRKMPLQNDQSPFQNEKSPKFADGFNSESSFQLNKTSKYLQNESGNSFVNRNGQSQQDFKKPAIRYSDIMGSDQQIGDTEKAPGLSGQIQDRSGFPSQDLIEPITSSQKSGNLFKKEKQNRTETQILNEQLEKEEKFKELTTLVNYYRSEKESMQYARKKIEEHSIAQLEEMMNSVLQQHEAENVLSSISALNGEIDRETATERKLTQVIADLNKQYQEIVSSVREMDFKRPTILSDDEKVIVDHIESLKGQMEEFYTEGDALSLSETLKSKPNQISFNGSPSQNKIISSKEEEFDLRAKAALLSINEANSASSDPHFLKNLKLACLRTRWKLLSAKSIQVEVDYDRYPVVTLKIGNKSSCILENFRVSTAGDDQAVSENYWVEKKSIVQQELMMKGFTDYSLFLEVRCSFETPQTGGSADSAERNRESHTLYVPTGLLNTGEFTPISFKEFQYEVSRPLHTIEGSFKPIDQSMVETIDDLTVYFPNLRKSPENENTYFGLFSSVSEQGSLVVFEESLGLLRITVKNGELALLRILEFIFTI